MMNNKNQLTIFRSLFKSKIRICTLTLLLFQFLSNQNSFAQTCPTCTNLQTTIIDVDALPICGTGTPLSFSGNISNSSCPDPNVSGLKCFAFKFTRASSSINQQFTFSVGQGSACVGELDKSYIRSGSSCTTLSNGGSGTSVTFSFPVGVNEATLYLCINSNSSVCLKGVCRPNPPCTTLPLCKLNNVSSNGCTIPTAFTNPTDVFTIGTCTSVLSMTSTDVGDIDICGGGNFVRTYRLYYADAAGNQQPYRECIQTIVITPPTATLQCAASKSLASCMAQSAIQAEYNAWKAGFAVTGGCGVSNNLSAFPSLPNNANCNGANLTFTLSANDGCGGTPQICGPSTFTVAPTTDKPVINTVNVNSDLGCNPSSITPPIFTVIDQCNLSANPTVITSGIQGTGCAKSQTWTASFTNACGNIADEKVITYTWIEDKTPPELDCPENITVISNEIDCSYIGTFQVPKVNDNCSETSEITITYTLSGVTTSLPDEFTSLDGVRFNKGVTTVTVKATDKCGNITTIPCSYDLTAECIPMPITLVSFEGKSTKNGNELNWKVSSESNFSHFEIERSHDTKLYQIIHKVNGPTNSKEMQHFSYLDKTTNGNNYYRLKFVDIDGKFTYSKVIYLLSANEKSIVGEFYPNPAFGNQININIDSNETTNWTITGYDISGKILKTEARLLTKGENIVNIVLEKESSIQIFRFENNGNIQFRKLIK